MSLKDHKPSFRNNPSCRLLNPCKPEIGRISKQIVEKLVSFVKKESGFIQWKNTKEVIDWFRNIDNKSKKSFIQFDIETFYPSITEQLLRDSIIWANTVTAITDFEKEVIFSCRNSLLYHNGEAWTKKGNKNFDVTMGSYDGAEICDLVGLFILSKLQGIGLSSVGLYRDDGLAVADKTPRQNDILKKKVCEVFRKVGLAITITANQNEVDFLDITINMKNETFKPFIKLNDKPEYVNKLSNHPPQILKNIPIGINKRLANISANKEIFENSTQVYSDELLQCGYEHQLSYEDFIHNNNTEKPHAEY